VALNLLDFLADYDGVGFPDLLRPQGVVIECALVLVRVAVKAAEKTATTALESCEADFFPTLVASVLLGLLLVLVVVAPLGRFNDAADLGAATGTEGGIDRGDGGCASLEGRGQRNDAGDGPGAS